MTAKSKQRSKARLACLAPSSIGGGDREIPEEFRIFSFGDNASEKGNFIFDQESALSVMEEFQKHGKPMLMDFNHGTTLAAPLPEQAISAGEFVPEVRADGLWAKMKRFTDRALGYLKAGEYRLFSPYFEHDKDGRVMRLINVALTNLPALDGIAPLVAASATEPDEGDTTMSECSSCSTLSKKLSDMEEKCTSLTARLSAFEEKKKETDADSEKKMSALNSVVALTGNAEIPASLGVLEGWKTKALAFDKLKQETDEKEATALRAELTTLLDTGVKEIKILPALRDAEEKAALAFGGGKPSKDGNAWLSAKLAASAPVLKTTATAALSAAGKMTPDQEALIKRHGLNPEIAAKVVLKQAGVGA